jgi:hypothetical protein
LTEEIANSIDQYNNDVDNLLLACLQLASTTGGAKLSPNKLIVLFKNPSDQSLLPILILGSKILVDRQTRS